MRGRHRRFEHAVVEVDRAHVDRQRRVAVVDRLVPLDALLIARVGDDCDLVLDDGRTKINSQVVRRAETIRELLPIDDDGDARVVKTGTDREVDDTIDHALRMRFSIEKELGSARLD